MSKKEMSSRIIVYCLIASLLLLRSLYSQVIVRVEFDEQIKESSFSHELFYLKDENIPTPTKKIGINSFEISKSVSLFQNDIFESLYDYNNRDSSIVFLLMYQETFFVIPINISYFRKSNYNLNIRISKPKKSDFAFWVFKNYGIIGLISFLIESDQYWMCILLSNSTFGCYEIWKFKKKQMNFFLKSINKM